MKGSAVSSAPLSVFCGKGGVGKTTLALGLGLSLARSGARTLVVTSHPLPELALSISLAGLKEDDPTAAARLFVVHIDPLQVMDDVVRAQIQSPSIATRVLGSRIYKNLVEIAPGLKEMSFLSRLRDLSICDQDDAYDHIVWDAPATGHFLEIFRVMHKFETFLTGPFALRGRDLGQFFAHADLRLYPVTTLEEMAIDEVLELIQTLSDEFDLLPAGLMLNLVSPLLGRLSDTPSPTVDAGGDDDSGWTVVLERLRVERQHHERLEAGVSARSHPVTRIRSQPSDLMLLDALAAPLAELKGERP